VHLYGAINARKAPNASVHQYSKKKNVLSNRPKTEMVWTGSRQRLGIEFHVIGPATEKARRPYEHSTTIGSIMSVARPSVRMSCSTNKRHMKTKINWFERFPSVGVIGQRYVYL